MSGFFVTLGCKGLCFNILLVNISILLSFLGPYLLRIDVENNSLTTNIEHSQGNTDLGATRLLPEIYQCQFILKGSIQSSKY